MYVSKVQFKPMVATAYAGSSDVIDFSFLGSDATNEYNIKSISGLDADSVVSTFYTGYNGLKLNTPKMLQREVVLQISLNPNFTTSTYSSLRDRLYKAIASSRYGSVKMSFLDSSGTTICDIVGTISKLEAPLFEKNQEISITLDCGNRMLSSPEPVIITPEEDGDTLLITDAVSTAPHGIIFSVKLIDPNPTFIMSDSDDFSWRLEIDPLSLGGFHNNDIINLINDESSGKFLQLERSGVTYELADSMVAGSSWPLIFPGNNRFGFNCNVHWLVLAYLTYFWGI